MLVADHTKSLLEQARETRNGRILQQVIDLERGRLCEYGTEEGLGKFRADKLIKQLKNSDDYAGFRKDCMTWLQHFKGGLECLNLCAHFNKQAYGVDPEPAILLRMTEKFDHSMATKSQILLGKRIEQISLDMHTSGAAKSSPSTEALALPPLRRMDRVELLNDSLIWDTEGEYLVLQVGSEIDESDPHYQQVQILAVPQASDSDDSLLLPKWEPRQAVRPKSAGKSVTFQKDVKKAKVELASDSEGADDAFEDGYSLEFPAYVRARKRP